MSPMKDFTLSSARPLPVILLLDVSGSMDGPKIQALNTAVADMVTAFADEDDNRVSIHVAVITFGKGGAQLHQELKPASEITWAPLIAAGKTPMGEAFSLAQKLVEDKDKIPGRAYAPALVLVSDGEPTDDWHAPLQALMASPRAAKAERFAMAIGDEARTDTLPAFLNNPDGKVFAAHDTNIARFFRRVTMSVAVRSRSQNPDQATPTDVDEPDF